MRESCSGAFSTCLEVSGSGLARLAGGDNSEAEDEGAVGDSGAGRLARVPFSGVCEWWKMQLSTVHFWFIRIRGHGVVANNRWGWVNIATPSL